MGEPITRDAPTPVDRLDYALIMSQEQQETLQGLGGALMNTDEDEDMDRMVRRSTINKNNFMETRQAEQVEDHHR